MNRFKLLTSFIFWLFMMAALFAWQYKGTSESSISGLLLSLRNFKEVSNWYGIYLGGRKIGCSELAFTADVSEQEVMYTINLSVMIFSPQEVVANGRISFIDSGEVSAFYLNAAGGGRGVSVEGERDGELFQISYNLRPPVQVDGGRRPVPLSGKLRLPLDEFEAADVSIDMMGEDIQIIDGAYTPVRRCNVSVKGHEAGIWLGPDGVPIKVEFPGGILAVREAAVIARGGR